MPPVKKNIEKRDRKVKAVVRDMDSEAAKKLIGFKTVEKGGFSYRRLNGTLLRFVMEKNTDNRPLSMPRAVELKTKILTGTFAGVSHSKLPANGEAWIIGKDGQVVSCAHRSVGLILANEDRDCMARTKDGKAQLKKWGVNGEIVINDQVVSTVEPDSADTADKAKARVLADVLFRRHEFPGKKLSASQLKTLSSQLATAVKHVEARTQGYRVRNAGKLDDVDAIEFLKKHPYLKKALVFVHGLNEGKAPSERVDQFQNKLGVIAAHLYLGAMQDIEYATYVRSNAVRKLPDSERWEHACDFWSEFAGHASGVLGSKDVEPSVVSLIRVLKESASKANPLDRDGLCTVTTRAMVAYFAGKEITPKALREGLKTASPPFARFGGLDVDREELKAGGLIEDLSILGVENQVLKYLSSGPKTSSQVLKFLNADSLPQVVRKTEWIDVHVSEDGTRSYQLTVEGKDVLES